MDMKTRFPLFLLISLAFILSGCGEAGDSYSTTGDDSGGGGGGAGIGTATVSWVAPSSRLDGTSISISEIGGYILYYGTSSANLTDAVTISGGSTNQHQISGLVSATYYFQVSAYDQQGIEGPRSGLASKVIP